MYLARIRSGMKWILSIVPDLGGKREPELRFLHGSLPFKTSTFRPPPESFLGSLLVQTGFFSYVGFRSDGSVLRLLYFNFELANIWSFFSVQQLL